MVKITISNAEAERMHKKIYMYEEFLYSKDFDCKDGFYTVFVYEANYGEFFQVVKKNGFVESIMKTRNGMDPLFYEVVE